jgi:UDP-GlcNAc:undecaprenyl-phosphate GlcNAc-1-phosphate transferase
MSFLSVLGFIFILRPIANSVGLVDKPGQRKQHIGNVPLIGGLAIFAAITICSFTLTPFDANYKMYLLSTSFMVLMGALDDYHDLDAKLRLIAQFLIGSLMVFGANLYIHDLGTIFGSEIVQLGVYGQLFTVLCVVACINAFNMTDGVDGLVGAMSINSFVSIGVLAIWNNVQFDMSFTSILIGAVVAFMFFNFGSFKDGKYKIFMGDAGSMLMGLTIIWLITFSTQSEQGIFSPVTALWIIAIPIMDMFSVMFRRVISGFSPLKASRDHLHHILLFNGLTNKQTTLAILAISIIFSIIGILSEIYSISESSMAFLFIITFVCYNSIMAYFEKKMSPSNFK